MKLFNTWTVIILAMLTSVMIQAGKVIPYPLAGKKISLRYVVITGYMFQPEKKFIRIDIAPVWDVLNPPSSRTHTSDPAQYLVDVDMNGYGIGRYGSKGPYITIPTEDNKAESPSAKKYSLVTINTMQEKRKIPGINCETLYYTNYSDNIMLLRLDHIDIFWPETTYINITPDPRDASHVMLDVTIINPPGMFGWVTGEWLRKGYFVPPPDKTPIDNQIFYHFDDNAFYRWYPSWKPIETGAGVIVQGKVANPGDPLLCLPLTRFRQGEHFAIRGNLNTGGITLELVTVDGKAVAQCSKAEHGSFDLSVTSPKDGNYVPMIKVSGKVLDIDVKITDYSLPNLGSNLKSGEALGGDSPSSVATLVSTSADSSKLEQSRSIVAHTASSSAPPATTAASAQTLKQSSSETVVHQSSTGPTIISPTAVVRSSAERQELANTPKKQLSYKTWWRDWKPTTNEHGYIIAQDQLGSPNDFLFDLPLTTFNRDHKSVELKGTVTKGSIGFGLLSSDRRKWIVLPQNTSGTGVFTLTLTPPEGNGIPMVVDRSKAKDSPLSFVITDIIP